MLHTTVGEILAGGVETAGERNGDIKIDMSRGREGEREGEERERKSEKREKYTGWREQKGGKCRDDGGRQKEGREGGWLRERG